MFKTTKAKIIFVIIFSIICIIVTTLLIWYQKIEIGEKKEDNTDIKLQTTNENEKIGLDLKGTYDQNDLKIVEKSITKEKIEIRYFQISGLKNKAVENKINNEIKDAALNCYKEDVKNMDEVLNIQVSMWETSNFANTISFELSYAAKIDDKDDGLYQGIQGLNYDLNTGERITLDKLFTSNAPIEDILRKISYYNLLSTKTEDNLAGELIVQDYGNIEDEIVQIINSYKNGKLTEFTYTPMNINIFYGERQIVIDMKQYANYINIYNRYLSSESLYEKDNIGIKNIYTLSRRYNDVYKYTNYQNEDNYFIDISIDFQCTESDEFAKNLMNDKIIAIEQEIENIKQDVKENPNDFYILNYYISIYTGQEWSMQQTMTNCVEKGNAYIMTVQEFHENIEPIIIEYNRKDENGGVADYIYDFTEKIGIEPQNTVEYYNPETGEKIVI